MRWLVEGRPSRLIPGKPLARDPQGLGIRVCLLQRDQNSDLSHCLCCPSDCQIVTCRQNHTHSADWLRGRKSVSSCKMGIMILTSLVVGTEWKKRLRSTWRVPAHTAGSVILASILVNILTFQDLVKPTVGITDPRTALGHRAEPLSSRAALLIQPHWNLPCPLSGNCLQYWE